MFLRKQLASANAKATILQQHLEKHLARLDAAHIAPAFIVKQPSGGLPLAIEGPASTQPAAGPSASAGSSTPQNGRAAPPPSITTPPPVASSLKGTSAPASPSWGRPECIAHMVVKLEEGQQDTTVGQLLQSLKDAGHPAAEQIKYNGRMLMDHSETVAAVGMPIGEDFELDVALEATHPALKSHLDRVAKRKQSPPKAARMGTPPSPHTPAPLSAPVSPAVLSSGKQSKVDHAPPGVKAPTSGSSMRAAPPSGIVTSAPNSSAESKADADTPLAEHMMPVSPPSAAQGGTRTNGPEHSVSARNAPPRPPSATPASTDSPPPRATSPPQKPKPSVPAAPPAASEPSKPAASPNLPPEVGKGGVPPRPLADSGSPAVRPPGLPSNAKPATPPASASPAAGAAPPKARSAFAPRPAGGRAPPRPVPASKATPPAPKQPAASTTPPPRPVGDKVGKPAPGAAGLGVPPPGVAAGTGNVAPPSPSAKPSPKEAPPVDPPVPAPKPPSVNTAAPEHPKPEAPFSGAKGSAHTPKGSVSAAVVTPGVPPSPAQAAQAEGDSKNSTPVTAAASTANAVPAAGSAVAGDASGDDGTLEVEGSMGDEELAVRIVHMDLTEEQLDESIVADIIHTVESGIGPPSYIMVGNRVLDNPNLTLREAGLGREAEFHVFLPEHKLLPGARDDTE